MSALQGLDSSEKSEFKYLVKEVFEYLNDV